MRTTAVLEGLEKQIAELVSTECRLSRLKKVGTLCGSDHAELKEVRCRIRHLNKARMAWIDEIRRGRVHEHFASKTFGEADEVWIILVTGIDAGERCWTSFIQRLDASITPSAGFKADFEEISQFYHLQLEAGRRMYIHTFLLDIIKRPEFKNSLRIFQEIEISAESNGRKLTGSVDFSIGFGRGSDVFGKAPSQIYLCVTVEAKKSQLDNSDFVQCLSEAATLYKARKDAGEVECSVYGVLSNATQWRFLLIDKDGKLSGSEDCCVWGVLSDAMHWKFIFIDDSGKLWRSDEHTVQLMFYDKEGILPVYRFLYCLIKRCFESCQKAISPRANSIQRERFEKSKKTKSFPVKRK